LIRPIGIATKRNYFVSPAARAFMETLQAVSGAYMRGPEAVGSNARDLAYAHLQ
jgi:hypothetical protein